jgi:hypothetical protein
MKGEEVIYVFLSPHDTPLENLLKTMWGRVVMIGTWGKEIV